MGNLNNLSSLIQLMNGSVQIQPTFNYYLYYFWASQVVLVVKSPPANPGDKRDGGLIPGLGRSPGEGYGNPLQYSCLKNLMDRGACQSTVHRVAKSQTRLSDLARTHALPLLL